MFERPLAPSRLCGAMAIAAVVLGVAFAARADSPPRFPASDSERLFAKAYSSLSAFFIKPVDVDPLAITGLQALRSLDPDFHIRREGTTVQLWRAERRLMAEEAPLRWDASGWSTLTTEIIARTYTDSAKVQETEVEQIFELILDTILSYLDQYSRYATPDEARNIRARRSGFGGIGIRLKLINGKAIIIEVMPDGPAIRAGLAVDDRVLSVNGIPLTGLEMSSIIHLMRGRVDTEMELRVLRRNYPPRTYTLKRTKVVPATIYVQPYNGIAHIRISSFNAQTSDSLVSVLKALMETAVPPMRGIILDLRGNPGGLLHEAINVADVFLNEGVVISTKGRHSKSSRDFKADGREIAKGIPVIALIDGTSASAAEIVAASLQAHDRAVVVGSNSFGKGVVQTVVRLPNGGEMTVTWSRLVGPAGNTFNKIGVMPTFCALGEQDGVEIQIGQLRSSELPTLAALARWRAASNEIGVERDQVRSICRGEEKDGTLGLRLARRILNDPALFASHPGGVACLPLGRIRCRSRWQRSARWGARARQRNRTGERKDRSPTGSARPT